MTRTQVQLKEGAELGQGPLKSLSYSSVEPNRVGLGALGGRLEVIPLEVIPLEVMQHATDSLDQLIV